MKGLAARDAFVGILFASALIGIALIGLAFGQSLKVGNVLSMSDHPLFRAGVQCLTTSAVCVLLLGVGRR